MRVVIGPYLNCIGPYQIADFLFEKWLGEEKAYAVGQFLSKTWLNDICLWIESKRKRRVKIQIDPYDTWSLDYTLALIILPALKAFSEKCHSFTYVENEDIPEDMKNAEDEEKWQWVLDEMIYAFESALDYDEENKFMLDPNGYSEYLARITNGRRLFGKYYHCLWNQLLQLSWLERTPDKREVCGSNPYGSTMVTVVQWQNAALWSRRREIDTPLLPQHLRKYIMFFDIGFWMVSLLPLLVPWIGKYFYHETIEFKEIGIVSVVTLLITATVYFFGMSNQTTFTELWNGQVVKTEFRESVCRTNNGGTYCRNSYSCNCVTVTYQCGTSKNPMTCTTIECDTCYRYPWERSYFAVANIGEIEIDRVDKQGAKQPRRWQDIVIGEPVTLPNRYTNYIKAVPESVFNMSMVLDEEVLKTIPDYPIEVYDYYHVNRILSIGQPLTAEQGKIWNEKLHEINGKLGPSKQSNVILMFINGYERSFKNSVLSKWVGGNTNDIIVMVGVDNDWNIKWSEIFSWAKFDIFNVSLRTEIDKMKTIDINNPDSILSIIYTTVDKEFVRRPMEEFEYLKEEIEPPTWVVLLALCIGLVVSTFTTIKMHRN